MTTALLLHSVLRQGLTELPEMALNSLYEPTILLSQSPGTLDDGPVPPDPAESLFLM